MLRLPRWALQLPRAVLLFVGLFVCWFVLAKLSKDWEPGGSTHRAKSISRGCPPLDVWVTKSTSNCDLTGWAQRAPVKTSRTDGWPPPRKPSRRLLFGGKVVFSIMECHCLKSKQANKNRGKDEFLKLKMKFAPSFLSLLLPAI